MIMFKDKLKFLGLDYRVASLIILYFVVPGISIPNQIKRIIRSHRNLLLKKVEKSTCIKWTYTDFLVTIIDLLLFLNLT